MNEVTRRFEDLEPIQQTAISMRYEGFRYNEIAATINRSHGRVKQWFMEGGMLYFDYLQYEAIRLKEDAERFSKSKRELEALAIDAIRVYKEILMNQNPFNNDSNRLKAAKDILDRVLGRPYAEVPGDGTEESEQNVNLTSLSDHELEALLKIAEKIANTEPAGNPK